MQNDTITIRTAGRTEPAEVRLEILPDSRPESLQAAEILSHAQLRQPTAHLHSYDVDLFGRCSATKPTMGTPSIAT